MKIFIILLALLSFIATAKAGDYKADSAQAHNYLLRAIDSINTGKFNEAVILCDSASILDPHNIAYPYEKALAFYKLNQIDSAITILDSLTKIKTTSDQVYQMLGNCYDALGKPDIAIEIYNNGLKKFPDSGRLFMEQGLYYYNQNEISDAVNKWETGIYHDPSFSNNYYILSKFYSKSGLSIWSLLYGEIYFSIADNENKVKELNRLLFNVYEKSFYTKKDSSIIIKFTTMTITSPVKRPDIDLPFEMAYQSVMEKASDGLLPKDSSRFNIETLYKIREKFIEIWFDEKLNTKFKNVLFDWHKTLIDYNLFETYTYLLFAEARVEEFNKWVVKDQPKLKKDINELINKYPFIVDSTHFLQKYQL